MNDFVIAIGVEVGGRIVLGSGDDRDNAENGQRDVINCGPGTDTAFVDEALDSFVNRADCEDIS